MSDLTFGALQGLWHTDWWDCVRDRAGDRCVATSEYAIPKARVRTQVRRAFIPSLSNPFPLPTSKAHFNPDNDNSSTIAIA